MKNNSGKSRFPKKTQNKASSSTHARPRKDSPQREHQDRPHERRGVRNYQYEEGSSAIRNSNSNEVIVIGRKPLLELIRFKQKAILRILLTEGLHSNDEFSQALKKVDPRQTVIETVSDEVLQSLVGDLNHQGVVSFVRGQEPMPLEEIIQLSLGPQGSGCLLVLDEISDPHNLGALFRACDALGVDGIIISKDRSAGVTPTVRKVSAGASEFVPYAIVTNLARSLEQIKAAGFWLIASDLNPQSECLGSREFPHPHALVLGSEGRGIRALTRKLCDFSVQIPMRGHVQSLNVSQAAGILLFELLKGRRSS